MPRPYFEQPALASAATRRLLLLSYNFPPARAVGGLRWQKLAGFAAERGWALDVIALDPSDLDAVDVSQLSELPAGTRVFAVRERSLRRDRIEEALSHVVRTVRRLLPRRGRPNQHGDSVSGSAPTSGAVRRDDLRWLRSPGDLLRAYRAWMWMERERDWSERALRLARLILHSGAHEVIVSCGPPHMPHIAGATVAEEYGLPFVMDLRDSWSSCEELFDSVASPLYLRLAERYERQAVSRAQLVVCNTDALRNAMRQAHATHAQGIITVMNGYDEEPVFPARAKTRFVIAYAGVIYIDRDPSSLFQAAARVVRDLALSPDEFAIEFMGHVDNYKGVPLAALARAAGIAGFVRVRPPGTRREAHAFLAEASMMVSLPQGLVSAIPSKVFEYMKFNAWILALAEPGSATELLLRGTGADVTPPDDLERIADIIRKRVLQYRKGELAPRLADRERRYSRREQARLLFDALDEVCARPATAARVTAIRSREAQQAAPFRDPVHTRAPVFLFSVDTEEDDWEPTRSEPKVENIRELPTLHSFLRRFGIRPTYFVTHQVMSRPASAETIRELHSSGCAEMAAHLHPWNTPPFWEPFEPRNSVLKNLSETLQHEKIQQLTRAFEEGLDNAPRAFRAGRWGLGAATVRALIRNGYEVDSSVTPYFNWEFMDEGANFVGSPLDAYRLSGTSDVRVPDPAGGLIEIPVSAGYSRTPFRLWHRVHGVLTAPISRTLRFGGIAARSGLVRKILLSPETNSAPQMVLLANRLLEQGVAHLHVVCHSQSLSPGLGPFVRTRADRARFYGAIEDLMNALSAQTSLRFATVSEAAELLMPRVEATSAHIRKAPAGVPA